MSNDSSGFNEKEKQRIIRRLKGRLQAAKNINPKIFPEINIFVNSIQ